MNRITPLFAMGLALLAVWLHSPVLAKALDLRGYMDATGAITVQHQGDTVDPYFALQALLLAQGHGLDVGEQAGPWSNWLARRYLATGQLGRYCKTGLGWAQCKAADADDASLALWLSFMNKVPPRQLKTARLSILKNRAARDLQVLRSPETGVYRVSREIPHSLFMDNLEIWSTRPTLAMARAIDRVFWDASLQVYRVTTQTAHPHPNAVFYPDATAQIYPLLLKFPGIPGGAPTFYRQWMAEHRQHWLNQMAHDFAWGLIALVAWEQGDLATVHCWQQLALPLRHSTHWTVTDEVVAQILPALPDPTTPQKDCP